MEAYEDIIKKRLMSFAFEELSTSCYQSIESITLPIFIALIEVCSNCTAAIASFRASRKFPDL